LITSFYSLPKMRSSAERIGAEAANSGVRPAIGDDRVVAAVAPDQVLAAAGRDRIGAVGGILAAHDGVVSTKPLSIAFYLSDETRLPLVLFILPGAIGAVFVGPSIAVLHARVRASLRPVASAVFGLLVNFIGLGAAPGRRHEPVRVCRLRRRPVALRAGGDAGRRPVGRPAFLARRTAPARHGGAMTACVTSTEGVLFVSSTRGAA
jgi:hypothetical protein